MENKQLAQGIASLGRYGDTTLMHMRPDEVQQLTAISRANGGDITINPDTGMPEAFLGNFISALAPTAAGLAAGAIFPGAPFLAPALAGGFTAYAQGKRDPLSIGMGALGGYGGAQLGSTLRGFGASQTPLAGTAEAAGGLEGTASTVAGEAGSTIGTTGGTTAGANTFGQQQFISPFTPQGVTGVQPNQFMGTTAAESRLGPIQAYNQRGAYAGPQGMAETLGKGGFQPNVPLEGGGYTSDFGMQQQAMQDYTGSRGMAETLKTNSFEQGLNLGKGLAETGKGFEAAMNDPMGYLKFAGKGDALMGGVKTALPFAGAGLEAYQKGMYEDMPTYEASTAGRYDPSRVLNLGMDTGLRLLAKGGEVKRYQIGGISSNEAGNFYQDTNFGRVYTGPVQIGGAGAGQPLYADPQRARGGSSEYGIVDVGGNFVKTSDKPGEGLMSKTDYYETYKFKQPGYTAEANKDQGDGGDFESKAGIQGGAGGINPAVALNVAQGYAESQQSNLDEQGLGTLKTGGSVRRFQMGGTTAERNMYGQQDSNEPAGLGSLTTAEQNLPGRQGMAGRTDLQNATTAEQNIAREPMQEAGTVVSSPMQNNVNAQPGDMGSRLPMGLTDMNANVTESLGEALQSNPQGFTVIPNQSIPPTSGEAPMMAMGGRVRYAEGGISALTPDDGKMLNGNGDGVSDDIPAMIEGEQEAALSDGEFIVPARIVSELGNGSSDAGAKKLYAMIDRIQAARQQTIGDNKQYAKDTNAERFLPV